MHVSCPMIHAQLAASNLAPNSKKHPTLPSKRDSSFWKLTQVGTFLLFFVLFVYLLTVPFNFLLKAQVSSPFYSKRGGWLVIAMATTTPTAAAAAAAAAVAFYLFCYFCFSLPVKTDGN